MTRQQVIESLERLTKILTQGCSNHGCVIVKEPRGMATNSICKCKPDYIARELEWLAREIKDSGSITTWKEE